MVLHLSSCSLPAEIAFRPRATILALIAQLCSTPEFLLDAAPAHPLRRMMPATNWSSSDRVRVTGISDPPIAPSQVASAKSLRRGPDWRHPIRPPGSAAGGNSPSALLGFVPCRERLIIGDKLQAFSRI